jgi:hypothetical protein
VAPTATTAGDEAAITAEPARIGVSSSAGSRRREQRLQRSIRSAWLTGALRIAG